MGFLSTSTSRENHVLKLVHPGGIAELHFNPVSASEIMKKNPRHWVTRPDFFKFPWIVVSPQSILTPGSVFFIVPSHTIRHLLKKKNNSQQSRSIESSDQVPQGCHSHRARRISHSNNKIQSFKQRSKTPREGHKHRNRGGDKACIFTPISEEEIPKLKPCLKNQNARSRDLRVSFAFIDDQVNTIKTCEF